MLESRQFEIRIADDSTRQSVGILRGVLMPYNEQARDRKERFETGALRWPDEGIVLREQHNRQAPIVRFQPVNDGASVRVEIALPDTQRGRDAATSVRNGTLRGLSVEFLALRETRQAGVRVIQAALLDGAGLVDSPSYGSAVIEIRAAATAAPQAATLWL